MKSLIKKGRRFTVWDHADLHDKNGGTPSPGYRRDALGVSISTCRVSEAFFARHFLRPGVTHRGYSCTHASDSDAPRGALGASAKNVGGAICRGMVISKKL
jgi:hypothetical protein